MTGWRKWFVVLLLAGAGGWWWVHASAGAVTNAPPRQGPIVALGDSLTAGVGAAPGQGYIDVLAGLIGKPVINRGIGGNTTADGLARVDHDVLAEKPGIVIVLLGGNDLLRRLDRDQAFQNLRTIVERCQQNGAMVALVGLDGVLLGDTGKRYRTLAKETGCVFVPNVMKDVYGNPKRMSDQIHPNAEGYRMMAERVADKLRPYLN